MTNTVKDFEKILALMQQTDYKKAAETLLLVIGIMSLSGFTALKISDYVC